MKYLVLSCSIIFFAINNFVIAQNSKPPSGQSKITSLKIIQDDKSSTISIFRKNGKTPILTQVAKDNFRPFLHPIVAPDGNGILTD